MRAAFKPPRRLNETEDTSESKEAKPSAKQETTKQAEKADEKPKGFVAPRAFVSPTQTKTTTTKSTTVKKETKEVKKEEPVDPQDQTKWLYWSVMHCKQSNKKRKTYDDVRCKFDSITFLRVFLLLDQQNIFCLT